MEQSADIFDKLNERQAEAVRTTEGNVCVVAGAGSGKTKTLASRFAYTCISSIWSVCQKPLQVLPMPPP